MDQARADVALSEPRIELAESILIRRQRLAEKGLTSVEDLDTAENGLAVARAQLLADKTRLRTAEIALSYTQVTAPISGVVAEVSAACRVARQRREFRGAAEVRTFCRLHPAPRNDGACTHRCR